VTQRFGFGVDSLAAYTSEDFYPSARGFFPGKSSGTMFLQTTAVALPQKPAPKFWVRLSHQALPPLEGVTGHFGKNSSDSPALPHGSSSSPLDPSVENLFGLKFCSSARRLQGRPEYF